ncbi:MAG: hypothetical protein AAFQ36_10110 [Pseudomonadota bacterium]
MGRLLGAFLLLGLGLFVAACSSPPQVANDPCNRMASLAPESNLVVPNDGAHNNARLAEAVAAAVNTQRCRAGLLDLENDLTLVLIAQGHTDDMSAGGFFSSNSPIIGKGTLGERLESENVRFAEALENLQKGFFMNYNKATNFRVINAPRCQYAQIDASGRPRLISRHTYITMAQDLVADMMNTPSQRAAIMSPSASRQGIAITPTGSTTLCGEFVANQLIVTDIAS